MNLAIVDCIREIDRIGEVQQQEHFSDKALETFTDILMHSDIKEETKQAFLHSATIYLDGKGYFSFLLHSYMDQFNNMGNAELPFKEK